MINESKVNNNLIFTKGNYVSSNEGVHSPPSKAKTSCLVDMFFMKDMTQVDSSKRLNKLYDNQYHSSLYFINTFIRI